MHAGQMYAYCAAIIYGCYFLFFFSLLSFPFRECLFRVLSIISCIITQDIMNLPSAMVARARANVRASLLWRAINGSGAQSFRKFFPSIASGQRRQSPVRFIVSLGISSAFSLAQHRGRICVCQRCSAESFASLQLKLEVLCRRIYIRLALRAKTSAGPHDDIFVSINNC